MPQKSSNTSFVSLEIAFYSLLATAALFYAFFTYQTSYSAYANSEDSAELFGTRISILIPEVIIWFLAAHVALRFKRYTASIKSSIDGKNLEYISNSLLFLVIYIVLITTSDTVGNMFAESSMLNAATEFKNHFYLIPMLVSGGLLYVGSTKLLGILPHKAWTAKQILLFVAPIIVCSGVFIWSFYNNAPYLLGDNGNPRFYLSSNLLIFTYALPQILIWFAGLAACFNLSYYSRKVKGVIYRDLFSDLYKGILLVFLCSFLAQLLILTTRSLKGFSFSLAMIYITMAITIVGFWYIYRGTKKLDKLEKVQTK